MDHKNWVHKLLWFLRKPTTHGEMLGLTELRTFGGKKEKKPNNLKKKNSLNIKNPKQLSYFQLSKKSMTAKQCSAQFRAGFYLRCMSE